MESEIAAAVKRSSPECGQFVGVIVERETTSLQSASNWDVKGVRFGKSDRRVATSTLDEVLERLQRKYSLA